LSIAVDGKARRWRPDDLKAFTTLVEQFAK